MGSNEVHVCIDPLSHQKPSIEEADMASRFVIDQVDRLLSGMEPVLKFSLFPAKFT
jgi:hypothetical protein